MRVGSISILQLEIVQLELGEVVFWRQFSGNFKIGESSLHFLGFLILPRSEDFLLHRAGRHGAGARARIKSLRRRLRLVEESWVGWVVLRRHFCKIESQTKLDIPGHYRGADTGGEGRLVESEVTEQQQDGWGGQGNPGDCWG